MDKMRLLSQSKELKRQIRFYERKIAEQVAEVERLRKSVDNARAAFAQIHEDRGVPDTD